MPKRLAKFNSRCPRCKLPIRANKNYIKPDALNRFIHASHNPLNLWREWRKKC